MLGGKGMLGGCLHFVFQRKGNHMLKSQKGNMSRESAMDMGNMGCMICTAWASIVSGRI